jgi:hypothetical protein
VSRLTNPEAQELAELAALLAEGARLSRGRSYQRKGNVKQVEVEPGTVRVSVAGSEPAPYPVSIACREASENERQAIADNLIDAVPRPLDVAFTCPCPDWGDPCKHGVAALLEFAREVDDDPSLLLAWRGVDHVVPPPPAGTESLVGNDAGGLRPGRASRAGVPSERPAPFTAVRSRWGMTGSSDDNNGLDADRGEHEDGGEADTAPELEPGLAAFFQGAMPDDVEGLVGPLDERQLEAYRGMRIMVENLDVAPVLADALEAVADHWLSR